MTMKEQAKFLKRLSKGISTLFGSNCEVTVHDLTKGYENTIIAIENGHVTNRHIGDGASEAVLEALKNNSTLHDHYSYMARTKDGRVVKSTSIYVRDENNKVIGLFGINYDVTELMMAQRAIDSLLVIDKPENDSKNVTITTNVNDLLDQLIADADAYVGKPVAMMSKEDKTAAIHYLNDKGAFLVKKAGDKVARHYDISKYTLYNYMDTEN
ncbi:MAG: transcriptional regulator [Oscillospiraceae bacterium]